jgi:hypothetical protein
VTCGVGSHFERDVDLGGVPSAVIAVKEKRWLADRTQIGSKGSCVSSSAFGGFEGLRGFNKESLRS